jgi:hypothetical protein
MNLILCLSSIGMYAPSMYATMNDQPIICVLGSMIATCSFLHHFTNKNGSFFHKLDLVVSRVCIVGWQSCIIVYGNDFVMDTLFVMYIISYLSYSYQQSCVRCNIEKCDLWVYSHLYFHFVSIASAFLTVKYLALSRQQQI